MLIQRSFARSILAGATLLAGLTNSPLAHGGVISFSNAQPGTDVTAGTIITVDLQMSIDTLFAFNQADVVVGSNEVTDLNFVLDNDWLTRFEVMSSVTFDSVGTFSEEVKLEGRSANLEFTNLVDVGKLIINTDAMDIGAYTVAVDDSSSLVALVDETVQLEQLTGKFDFNIVPEPASWVAFICLVTPLVARRHTR